MTDRHSDHPLPEHGRNGVSRFQLLLVLLSVYVLAALTVELAVPLSQRALHNLQRIDSAICVLFLFDFFHRLCRAPRKLHFLKWGWIDFVSSLPAVSVFRWGRIVRVVRVLRATRSARWIFTFLFATRARGAFASVGLFCVLLVVFCSIAILHVETDADSNIRNAGDALWWAVETITTVGYGDRYPVTAEGRVLGVALMTAGVALYGVFTGFIASWFLQQDKKPETSLDFVEARFAELHAEIGELRQQMARASGPAEAEKQ